MGELVPTNSFSHPIRPLPNDAPYGTLRIVVWHTFDESGATGTVYIGPMGKNRDQWQRISGPENAPRWVQMTEARWTYGGINLDTFVIHALAWHPNDIDDDLRELARLADEVAQKRGWKTQGRDFPTKQQVIDIEVVAAAGAWNEVEI